MDRGILWIFVVDGDGLLLKHNHIVIFKVDLS